VRADINIRQHKHFCTVDCEAIQMRFVSIS
jgi:hypothetical protein